jgi:hypothetical protein
MDIIIPQQIHRDMEITTKLTPIRALDSDKIISFEAEVTLQPFKPDPRYGKKTVLIMQLDDPADLEGVIQQLNDCLKKWLELLTRAGKGRA